MVGTLNGKIVPLETPNAEPWYQIDREWAAMGVLLTDGDRYCWKAKPSTFWSIYNPKWAQIIRDAIERYNEKIGVWE